MIVAGRRLEIIPHIIRVNNHNIVDEGQPRRIYEISFIDWNHILNGLIRKSMQPTTVVKVCELKTTLHLNRKTKPMRRLCVLFSYNISRETTIS